MGVRGGLSAGLAALAVGLAWVAPAAADVSGPEIVSFLSAQRAAHGIPAGIAEDPGLSDGCAKHNAYGRTNNVLEHSEDPGRPGYTAEGDQAARTSVLYQGGPWTAARNPFETAPIHLHQLLAPRLDRMGASENAGYGCATTFASRNRPAPAADMTYTYPGDGATGWTPSQVAYESPYTPGQQVGIPAGTETGPYLYVMFDGPDIATFDEASGTTGTITGPDGPVSTAVVDNQTPGLENYLPAGAQLIPRAPLRAGATYTASVSATVTTQGGAGTPRAFSHTWSFTTGSRTPRPAGPTSGQPAGSEEQELGAGTPARARPFRAVVPRRVRRGRRIVVKVRSRSRFSIRLRVATLRGRTLVRSRRRGLAGGSTWTWRLRVPKRHSKPGRRVRLTMVIVSGDRRDVVRRTVRFY